MRYPQGGGLTAERRAVREAVRLEAASRFAAGQDNAMIARELRVHVRSVQRWRAAWEVAGEQALRSKGPPSLPTLSDESFAALEAELEKGSAAHGWSVQRWALSRIKTLIGRRFHQPYTEQGVRKLLVRHGWSWQMPARRAVERDEQAVAARAKGTWPAAEEPRRRSAPGSCSRTKPGSR